MAVPIPDLRELTEDEIRLLDNRVRTQANILLAARIYAQRFPELFRLRSNEFANQGTPV